MAISPALFLSELTFHRSSVVKVVVKGMTSSFQFLAQNIRPQTAVEYYISGTMKSVVLTVTLGFLPLVLCVIAEQPSRHRSVLIITPPMSGHLSVPIALGEELVRRGHNVTLFTLEIRNFDRPRKSVEEAGMKYLSVDVNITYDDFEAATEAISLSNDTLGMFRKLTGGVPLIQRAMQNAESALDGALLRNYYDIILTTEFSFPVAMCMSKKWNVPLIHVGCARQIFPHQLPSWPHPGPLSRRTDDVNFMGRLSETVYRYIESVLFSVIVEVIGLKLQCPYELSTLARAAGVLVPHIVPTAIGFEYPRPLSPLTTYVGPILPPVTDPLPGEIQMWLDSRPIGSVVYISMGSLAFITPQLARAIVEGLDATGYNALWSLRRKNRAILDGLEVNDKKILLLDWAPQLAILRHRSIRMAILHGGMNGVQEALHSGVPIIVLPLGGDQPANAVRVVHGGFGIQLNHNTITGTQITEGIHTIERGNYSKTVNRLRKIFHHAGGVTKAADLVELYAEVGYDHLIPAYARYGWTWIQYYNVDVYGLLLVIGGGVVWIVLRLCRCACGRCCRCISLFSNKPKQE